MLILNSGVGFLPISILENLTLKSTFVSLPVG